jgi:arylsulfatase
VVATGNVPRSPSLFFTTNDTFDVGMDSYSPVSEDYYDRAPFAFKGRIEKVFAKYIPDTKKN